MKYKIVMFLSLLLVSFSAQALTLSAEAWRGKGEFGNFAKTTTEGGKVTIGLGRLDVGLIVEDRQSAKGPIDDPNFSLIEGVFVFGCVGYRVTDNTRVQGCASDRLWEGKVEFTSDPQWMGIQVTAGASYSNTNLRENGVKYKRKTVNALLGVQREMGYGLTVGARVRKGNNTQRITDDQIQGFLEYEKRY